MNDLNSMISALLTQYPPQGNAPSNLDLINRLQPIESENIDDRRYDTPLPYQPLSFPSYIPSSPMEHEAGRDDIPTPRPKMKILKPKTHGF